MIGACPQCGRTVSTFLADPLCPECLKRVALREPAGGHDAYATDLADDLLPETARWHSHGHHYARPVAANPDAERFGDYDLLEPLGHGAMGTVIRARHVQLNRIVALKLIRQG